MAGGKTSYLFVKSFWLSCAAAMGCYDKKSSEDSSSIRDEVVCCLGVIMFVDIMEKRREPERVIPSGP